MGRKIPLWQALLVMLVMLALLFWEIIVAGDEEGHIALIVAAAFATIVAVLNGWKWSFLEKGIINAISRSMQAMLILMVVGLMLGAWVAGGVVPTMMYFGIKVLAPSIFLFAACLLCSIVSLATGSSWSTAGSMGVALIGVGTALGFPPAMTAGAVVSGAYFGDKMSPLSDTTNLAPAVAGSNLFDHIKHMIWTVTPSLCVALIAYLVMGFVGNHGGDADMSTVTDTLAFIQDNFKINVLFLIPPVFVIVAVALKLPALPSLIGGVLLGVPCMAIQGVEATSWMGILNYGSGVDNPIAEGEALYDFYDSLCGLLSSSGMQGMMWTISLILCAMVFGGVLDASGMLGTLAESLLKLAKNTGSLVTITILSCIFVNIVACDQYLAIILPGRMYKEAFEDRRLKPENLSRALEDSATITSNLVPWNTCGATMRSFLQVNQWGPGGYAPFAILNWFNPLVSIFYGFTGISMKKMTEEEYAKVVTIREEEKAMALKELEA